MGIYDEKQRLYRDYLKELDTYREAPLGLTDGAARRWCDDYISWKKSSWHNIYAPGGEELVGFLIIGKEVPEKHPDSIRSVAQAYVDPRYRNQGLMTACMADYMTRHRGVYSLLVLKNNENAREFWKNFFKKQGYRPVELDPSIVTDNDVELYGFEPAK